MAYPKGEFWRRQKLINDELGFTIMPTARRQKIDETAVFPLKRKAPTQKLAGWGTPPVDWKLGRLARESKSKNGIRFV